MLPPGGLSAFPVEKHSCCWWIGYFYKPQRTLASEEGKAPLRQVEISGSIQDTASSREVCVPKFGLCRDGRVREG